MMNRYFVSLMIAAPLGLFGAAADKADLTEEQAREVVVTIDGVLHTHFALPILAGV